MTQCVYLGHVVGGGRVGLEPSKVEAIQPFPIPTTKRGVKSFLGITGYYRRFIPEFATIAAPLTDLVRKNCPNKVKWTKQCEELIS